MTTDSLVVIDASLVVKALLPNPLITNCQAVLRNFSATQLAAPALLAYEITTALTKAAHFQGLSEADATDTLHQAFALNILLIPPDELQSRLAFGWTRRLLRAAAYDSFYLATAEALEVPFWTADLRLINALQDQNLDWVHSVEQVA